MVPQANAKGISWLLCAEAAEAARAADGGEGQKKLGKVEL
jgi:hypothetical protein